VIREAAIEPSPILRDRPISVRIHADDPEFDTLTFHYQWVLNGQALVGATTATLSSDMLKQGDKLSLTVVPDDGKSKGATYTTSTVSIGNAPPVVTSAVIQPQQTNAGYKLQASVDVHDPDRDDVVLTYRWTRNGKTIQEGQNSVLDATGLTSKDVIMVEATPRDGSAEGKTVKSSPLILGNSPPAIVSTPPTSIGNERFEYVVKANDPEGEGIRYRLDVAPSGMSIDAVTGRINWPLLPGLTGRHKIRVVAEDAHGASAFQEFEIALPESDGSRPKGT
jgi:hypothetical protein